MNPPGPYKSHGPPKSPWAPYIPVHGAYGNIFLTTSEGWKLMEKSPKNIWDYNILVKSVFFEAVNQLKKTSDCIKIDPPGPGRNLEKKPKNIFKKV